jgi:hypothetical protein
MLTRGATVVAGLFLAASTLAGCGDGSGVSAAADAVQEPRPAHFDAIVIGNEQDDVRHGDLFGMTFQPLRRYRLTTDKSIDSVAASGDAVIVSAADQQVDQLGQLGPGGQILPIPGLGRPHAFGPEIRPDGVIRYEDAEGDEPYDGRFIEWNPRTKSQKVLRVAKGGFGSPSTLPGDLLLYSGQTRANAGRILIVGPGNASKLYQIAQRIGQAAIGPKLLAIDVEDPKIDYVTVGLVLFDPKTGKQDRVDGWSPVAWSPDGTKLLVERLGAPAGVASELALLNPADATHPRLIGTVPHLAMYQGSWLRGGPAA